MGDEITNYLDGYEFRGDDGDYTPTEEERLLIEDAMRGFQSEQIEALRGQLAKIEGVKELQAAGFVVPSDQDIIDELSQEVVDLEESMSALRLKLADCQAVIRSRGHDADCPALFCGICGNRNNQFMNHHTGRLPSHNFAPQPCSDACGYSRCVGVE